MANQPIEEDTNMRLSNIKTLVIMVCILFVSQYALAATNSRESFYNMKNNTAPAKAAERRTPTPPPPDPNQRTDMAANSMVVGSNYVTPLDSGKLVVEDNLCVKTQDAGQAAIAVGGSSLEHLPTDNYISIYAKDPDNLALGTLGHRAPWGAAGVFGKSWSPTAVGVFGSVSFDVTAGAAVQGLIDLDGMEGGEAVSGNLAYKTPEGNHYSGMFKGGNFCIQDLPVYADNESAKAGGLKYGTLYRSDGDPSVVCIVY